MQGPNGVIYDGYDKITSSIVPHLSYFSVTKDHTLKTYLIGEIVGYINSGFKYVNIF